MTLELSPSVHAAQMAQSNEVVHVLLPSVVYIVITKSALHCATKPHPDSTHSQPFWMAWLYASLSSVCALLFCPSPFPTSAHWRPLLPVLPGRATHAILGDFDANLNRAHFSSGHLLLHHTTSFSRPLPYAFLHSACTLEHIWACDSYIVFIMATWPKPLNLLLSTLFPPSPYQSLL